MHTEYFQVPSSDNMTSNKMADGIILAVTEWAILYNMYLKHDVMVNIKHALTISRFELIHFSASKLAITVTHHTCKVTINID